MFCSNVLQLHLQPILLFSLNILIENYYQYKFSEFSFKSGKDYSTTLAFTYSEAIFVPVVLVVKV